MKVNYEINSSLIALIKWFIGAQEARYNYGLEYGSTNALHLSEIADTMMDTFVLYTNIYNHAKQFSPDELPAKPTIALNQAEMVALNNLFEMINKE